jgi:hypothetical protein
MPSLALADMKRITMQMSETKKLETSRRKWHTKRRGIKTRVESAIDEKPTTLSQNL